MADKKPIRTVFNDSNVATGLAEFQTGETVGLAHGGLGAALTIGSAGQVLKVNTGGSALEFGAVEAIINIDTATDLTSNTLVAGDQIMASDGGSEGRVTLGQLDTLFSGTTKTLTNKTLTSPVISSITNNSNTLTLPTTADTILGRATTDTLTNKSISGSSNTLSNIGNSSLSNSAVTVGTTSISLGASATTIAGVSDLTAGSINIAGNVIKSNDSTIVEIGAGDGLSVAGNLTVAGNMTVSGSTTTVSSTNTTLADQFIELGTGRSGSASGDSGIVIERGSDANAIIGFDESSDEFIVGTGTFTGSSSGNLTFTHGTLSTAGNKIYKAGTAHSVSLVASSSLASNVTLTLPINDGDTNQLLSTDGSGNLSFISATAASGAGLSDLSDDSTPSLGGNLDMNGNDIITLSNANIDLLPHGTGKIIMDGNGTAGGVLVSDGLIEVKTGTGNVAKIQFYCETGNAHAQTLQAAPHSAGSSAVLTLPTATGTLVATGDTNSVSNAMITNSTITIQDDSSTQDAVALGETIIFEGGSGVTTTVTDNKVSIATDGSIVTETSTDTLTNKTLTSPVINSPTGDFIKIEGTNFSDSLLIGHATTGTLNAANDNTGVGIDALKAITSGDANTAVGHEAGLVINSGLSNTILGAFAGKSINSGDYNVAIGEQALASTTTSNRNTAVGRMSMLSNQTGAENVALGYGSGSNVTGSNNTLLGYTAGDNITSGSGNVIIGGVDAASATGSRQLKIAGYDGTDTTTWISGDSSGNVTLGGNLIIGSATVTEAQLEVLDGATLSTTELNFVDGVTSAIQTQLDNKAAKSFAIAQAVALG